MELEPSSARPRMYRCYCRRRFPLQRETNPLFRAVLSNDLKEVRTLVEAGSSINVQNTKGSSLLNFVMRRKRVEIFDYLMSLEIDVNFLDRLEQSPLIYLAGVCFDEYFALQLIKKGADIHLTDDSGFTFLHLAAKSETDDNLTVGQLIIEKGANVNQQGQYGVTPLYAACETGNFNWVCMLLYYGADATIPSDRGVLPLAVVSQEIPEEQQLQLQEILFNYTFDKEEITIRLPTLVAAMTLNSNLFSKILNNVENISYDVLDLQHMVSSLIHVKPKHLQLFIEKFGYIVKEMLDNFSTMDVLVKIALDCGIQGLKELLIIFLESDYVEEFIQPSNTTNPTISNLLEIFNNQDQLIDQEEFTKMICIMLSYGLCVTSADLDAVYHYFGCCELFKILLHMEVLTSNNGGYTAAVLYYNPSLTIDMFCGDVSQCAILLDYFNYAKLKEVVLANSGEQELIEKIGNLPQVPLLIELSRNAARNYIVNRFHIKNSVQFYTVLQWLPVGEMNRSIIALEKKLYF